MGRRIFQDKMLAAPRRHLLKMIERNGESLYHTSYAASLV